MLAPVARLQRCHGPATMSSPGPVLCPVSHGGDLCKRLLQGILRILRPQLPRSSPHHLVAEGEKGQHCALFLVMRVPALLLALQQRRPQVDVATIQLRHFRERLQVPLHQVDLRLDVLQVVLALGLVDLEGLGQMRQLVLERRDPRLRPQNARPRSSCLCIVVADVLTRVLRHRALLVVGVCALCGLEVQLPLGLLGHLVQQGSGGVGAHGAELRGSLDGSSAAHLEERWRHAADPLSQHGVDVLPQLGVPL
mmetsp:Transcript_39499/g.112011  ORF Transcript_39499/g.112011 Transcript_39499/m.112011 type:complete len:252 (+) Transcript_39499:772-1527(+)